MIQIRTEQPEDASAIYQLTTLAFGASALGHHGEADLIGRIRAAHAQAISLVAVLDGSVVGHLLSSPASLRSKLGVVPGTAIGPISVLPTWQRQGCGGLLITELLKVARQRDEPFVAVAGHRDYYPRFGFHPLLDFGIRHCFSGMPDEMFFIKFLAQLEPLQTDGSLLRYCDEFGPQNRFSNVDSMD